MQRRTGWPSVNPSGARTEESIVRIPEVDGPPVLWQAGQVPLRSGLGLGAGRRVETFAGGGMTHLVESLPDVGQVAGLKAHRDELGFARMAGSREDLYWGLALTGVSAGAAAGAVVEGRTARRTPSPAASGTDARARTLRA